MHYCPFWRSAPPNLDLPINERWKSENGHLYLPISLRDIGFSLLAFSLFQAALIHRQAINTLDILAFCTLAEEEERMAYCESFFHKSLRRQKRSNLPLSQSEAARRLRASLEFAHKKCDFEN